MHDCPRCREAARVCASHVREDLSIPVDYRILGFCHCRMCVQEKAPDVSMAEYAALEVGMTEHGIQVWCLRHQVNVIHVSFDGKQLPANNRKEAPPSEGVPSVVH